MSNLDLICTQTLYTFLDEHLFEVFFTISLKIDFIYLNIYPYK